MKTIKYLLGLTLLAGLFVLPSCSEDEPGMLNIVSIVASGNDVKTGAPIDVDINGATSATTVPVSPTIKITFDKELDAATVSSSTIIIDGVPTSVATSGTTVTVTLANELIRGTTYNFSIGALKAKDGGAFTPATRSFKTGGRAPVVAPKESAQLAFWKFNNSSNDETGIYNADYTHKIEYVTDRHGEAASSAKFDGDASIIEVNDSKSLMAERSSWTISFWMKGDTLNNPNTSGNGLAGQFVFGMGAFYGFRMEASGSFSNFNMANRWEVTPAGAEAFERNEGFSFNGDGNYNATGGWRGHTFNEDLRQSGGVTALLVNKWAHVVFTYDAPSKIASIFINGKLMKEQDYNLYAPHPMTDCVGWKYDGTEPSVFPDMTFGFVHSRRGTLWDTESFGNYDSPTSNHFKGEMDDFRIFSASYSAADVTALYNAEKP